MLKHQDPESLTIMGKDDDRTRVQETTQVHVDDVQVPQPTISISLYPLLPTSSRSTTTTAQQHHHQHSVSKGSTNNLLQRHNNSTGALSECDAHEAEVLDLLLLLRSAVDGDIGAAGGGGGFSNHSGKEMWVSRGSYQLRELVWKGCPPRARYACWSILLGYIPATASEVRSILGEAPTPKLSLPTTPLPPPILDESLFNTLNHFETSHRLRRVNEYRSLVKASYDSVPWDYLLKVQGFEQPSLERRVRVIQRSWDVREQIENTLRNGHPSPPHHHSFTAVGDEMMDHPSVLLSMTSLISGGGGSSGTWDGAGGLVNSSMGSYLDYLKLTTSPQIKPATTASIFTPPTTTSKSISKVVITYDFTGASVFKDTKDNSNSRRLCPFGALSSVSVPTTPMDSLRAVLSTTTRKYREGIRLASSKGKYSVRDTMSKLGFFSSISSSTGADGLHQEVVSIDERNSLLARASEEEIKILRQVRKDVPRTCEMGSVLSTPADAATKPIPTATHESGVHHPVRTPTHTPTGGGSPLQSPQQQQECLSYLYSSTTASSKPPPPPQRSIVMDETDTTSTTLAKNNNNNTTTHPSTTSPSSSSQRPAIFQHPLVKDLMERILYLWSLRHPASGYVQGMNDLLLPFLVTVFAEALYFSGSNQLISANSTTTTSPQQQQQQNNTNTVVGSGILSTRGFGADAVTDGLRVPNEPQVPIPRRTPCCEVTHIAGSMTNGDTHITALLDCMDIAALSDLMVQKGLLLECELVNIVDQEVPPASNSVIQGSSVVLLPDTTAGNAADVVVSVSQGDDVRDSDDHATSTINLEDTQQQQEQSSTTTSSTIYGGNTAVYQEMHITKVLSPSPLWVALESDVFHLFSAGMDTVQDQYTALAMQHADGPITPKAASADDDADNAESHHQQQQSATTKGTMYSLIHKLDRVVQQADPPLHQFITGFVGISFELFAFRWMTCFLLRELPPLTCLRLFDTYVSEVASNAAGGDSSSPLLTTNESSPRGGSLSNKTTTGGSSSSGEGGSSSTANFYVYASAALLIDVYGPKLASLYAQCLNNAAFELYLEDYEDAKAEWEASMARKRMVNNHAAVSSGGGAGASQQLGNSQSLSASQMGRRGTSPPNQPLRMTIPPNNIIKDDDPPSLDGDDGSNTSTSPTRIDAFGVPPALDAAEIEACRSEEEHTVSSATASGGILTFPTSATARIQSFYQQKTTSKPKSPTHSIFVAEFKSKGTLRTTPEFSNSIDPLQFGRLSGTTSFRGGGRDDDDSTTGEEEQSAESQLFARIDKDSLTAAIMTALQEPAPFLWEVGTGVLDDQVTFAERRLAEAISLATAAAAVTDNEHSHPHIMPSLGQHQQQEEIFGYEEDGSLQNDNSFDDGAGTYTSDSNTNSRSVSPVPDHLSGGLHDVDHDMILENSRSVTPTDGRSSGGIASQGGSIFLSNFGGGTREGRPASISTTAAAATTTPAIATVNVTVELERRYLAEMQAANEGIHKTGLHTSTSLSVGSYSTQQQRRGSVGVKTTSRTVDEWLSKAYLLKMLFDKSLNQLAAMSKQQQQSANNSASMAPLDAPPIELQRNSSKSSSFFAKVRAKFAETQGQSSSNSSPARQRGSSTSAITQKSLTASFETSLNQCLDIVPPVHPASKASSSSSKRLRLSLVDMAANSSPSRQREDSSCNSMNNNSYGVGSGGGGGSVLSSREGSMRLMSPHHTDPSAQGRHTSSSLQQPGSTSIFGTVLNTSFSSNSSSVVGTPRGGTSPAAAAPSSTTKSFWGRKLFGKSDTSARAPPAPATGK